MPYRVQLSRAAGWRMPENTVKVDRSTRWGNPFVPGPDASHADCVEAFSFCSGGSARLEVLGKFRMTEQEYRAFRKRMDELEVDPTPLRGKNLACWCRLDQPCHADELLRWVNRDLALPECPF